MARLQEVKKPLYSVGSFSNELANGMTMEEIQQNLQRLDLEDGEALKAQAECCSPCCSGNTIIIKVPNPALEGENRPKPGEESKELTMEFKMP